MKMNRLQFLQMSSGALAGFIIGLDSCNTSSITIRGNVYDFLGFPVEGAQITLVSGYALSDDDGLGIAETLGEPVNTGSLGEFEIQTPNANKDVGVRVTRGKVIQRTVCRDVTGTGIPFYETEVWSPDGTKAVNQIIGNDGILSNIKIFIDPSRTYIWNYFIKNYPLLYSALINNHATQHYWIYNRETGKPWEGNHTDPDDPDQCNNCDNHYGWPVLSDPSKKINPPWGIKRGVIPFVCAEGSVFHTDDEIQNGSGDNDWEWDINVEPQYNYLPNIGNQNTDPKFLPRGDKQFALHCEMCNWFMGPRNTHSHPELYPHTSISRGDEIAYFVNKRVWMIGTWTVDTGHSDCHNEIHPIYWVVPFMGGWRRFCASEIVRIGLNASGAKAIIADQLTNDPASLIETLSANFKIALLSMNFQKVQAFYRSSVIHLNKFGLNCAFPNVASDPLNSIDEPEFPNLPTGLTIDQMTENIQTRYTVLFNHLTALGSGVYVFPSMLFCYEGTKIIEQAKSSQVATPLALNTFLDAQIQVSLGKQLLALEDTIIENGLDLLKYACEELFNQMHSSPNTSLQQIADYYADTAIRLISYGMYDNDDQNNSPNRDDHYNWALARAADSLHDLIDLTQGRICDLWRNLFPFATMSDCVPSAFVLQ